MGWMPSLGLIGGLHSARQRVDSGEPKCGGNRLPGFFILIMARKILLLGWLMSIYRELFARQIGDFSSTRSSIY